MHELDQTLKKKLSITAQHLGTLTLFKSQTLSWLIKCKSTFSKSRQRLKQKSERYLQFL